MKSPRILTSAILVGSTLLFTACQSINGVDLNHALTEQNVSAEASAHLSWDLLTDPDVLAESPSKDKIQLIQNGEIDLPEIKAADAKHASINGTFTLHGRKVPLGIYLNNDETVLKLGGLQKYIQSTKKNSSEQSRGLGMLGGTPIASILQSFQSGSEQESTRLFQMLVKDIPNPQNITAEKKTVMIHGDSVALTNVTATITGPDLPDLVVKFVDNLVADDDTLKAILSSTHSDTNLDDVKKTLKQFKRDIVNENATFLDLITKKSNSLQITLGIDENSRIRTIYTDLTLKFPHLFSGSSDPVIGIHTVLDVNLWNIGQSVQADTVPNQASMMSSDINNGKALLKMTDPNSDLYKLLHDDFKIQNQHAQFFYNTNLNEKYVSPYSTFINNNGTMMIGARYFAERLGLSVGWDDAAKTVTLDDGIHVLKFSVDQTDATFDGNPVTLTEAPKNLNGSIFIPLRSVSELFGMKIKLGEKFNRMIEIDSEE